MKALVTGAGGYLGGAITRALMERGDEVVCLQRGDYAWLHQSGIEVRRGDIAEPGHVLNASRGCDVVFHVAGMTGVWGPESGYVRTNVTGTEMVIQACRQNRVPALVYTSSPSVVFDGSDESGIDESRPYPERFFNHYQSTKARAEQLVLQASSDVLGCVALRPHLIWGPGDPHLIGRILERARTGRLRLVKSANRVDTTFVDNAALAHLLAADALLGGRNIGGRKYFISNGEPAILPDLINRILTASGMPPASRYVSPATAYLAGTLSEWYYRASGRQGEPLMTRFIARQLSCDHWYDISAAHRDLGYVPQVSIEQGLAQLVPRP